MEDPFDSTDNCARTIAAHASRPVVQAFEAAVEHMLCVDPTTVPGDESLQGKPLLGMLLAQRFAGLMHCLIAIVIITGR